jgi:hypothetical protein
MAEMTENFERSPFRDDVLELIASASAKGIPISAVLALPGAGSRDAVDHLLSRMVSAGEIERCARGRYVLAGTLQRQTALAAPPQRRIEPRIAGAAPTHRAGWRAHHALADEILFERLGLVAKQPTMIDPVDFDKFLAQVGCLCTKYGLSPPFRLRDLAAAWAALGIPLAHCLGTIEAYLTAHAGKCYSGASDRLFRWVDIFLRGPASSSRLAHADIGTIKRVERVREEDWQGEY